MNFVALISIIGGLIFSISLGVFLTNNMFDSTNELVNISCILMTIFGFALFFIPLASFVKQGKQDVQEVFVLTENKEIVNVNVTENFKATSLTIMYIDENKEIAYENLNFCGEINTELSKDGKYHIGTKEERDEHSCHITIFEPEANQSELYVSK